MDDRTCPAPGCTKMRGLRQRWCPMHSRRLRLYGSLDLPQRSPRPPRLCTEPDCDNPHSQHGLCVKHASRLKRTGTPTSRQFGPKTHTQGYTIVTAPDHPLAVSRNTMYEHRKVLFDAIGYGPHRCHWCSTHINWRAPRPHALEADHVDYQRDNNHVTNLVPSCHGCNSRRALARVP